MNLKVKFILLASVLTLCYSPIAQGADNTQVAKDSSSSTYLSRITAESLLKKIHEDKGKVVVINIFASWCPPCREETPGIIETRKQFSEKDVVVYGVSVDKTEAAFQNFVGNYPFNYPVFMGDDKFIETFKINAIPQMIIYSKKGNIAVNHKGLLEQEELTHLIQKEVDKK